MARPLRGAVLAALATLLTVVGHVAGGGAAVQLAPVTVLLPLLATVLVAVAERCRGVAATVVALGAGQAVLHLVLSVLTGHDHMGPTWSMLTAHALATVLLAAVLCSADRAVAGLVRALRRILPRRLRTRAVVVPLPARPVPNDVPLLASVVLVVAHARRGPPRLA